MKSRFLTAVIVYALGASSLGRSIGEIGVTVSTQTSNTVVAEVNGRKITLKEVHNSITSELFSLEANYTPFARPRWKILSSGQFSNTKQTVIVTSLCR